MHRPPISKLSVTDGWKQKKGRIKKKKNNYDKNDNNRNKTKNLIHFIQNFISVQGMNIMDEAHYPEVIKPDTTSMRLTELKKETMYRITVRGTEMISSILQYR